MFTVCELFRFFFLLLFFFFFFFFFLKKKERRLDFKQRYKLYVLNSQSFSSGHEKIRFFLE